MQGYLPRTSQKDIDKLNELKQQFNFSETKGFLGKNGCMLPRQLRSLTCNSFMCSSLSTELQQIYKLEGYELIDKVNKLVYGN